MNPKIRKFANYTAAYVLFVLLALFGLVLVLNIHTALIRLSALFGLRSQVAYAIYTWGAFLLFLIYISCVALIESLLNQAAKNGQVLRRGVMIFCSEGVLWLVTNFILLFLAP